MCTRQSQNVIWDMINTLFLTMQLSNLLLLLSLSTRKHTSMASRVILSNFFEKQWTHNNPQYLSGYSCALFPTTFPELAVYAALCTDPALACVSRRFVRLLFHLPKNKATAGEKAASQVGWWLHRKWFSPHVAVVTPLHSEILKSLLSGPWTTSFLAFSVNAFRWRIRDEKTRSEQVTRDP